MPPERPVNPRTYFLNEQHELARGEKDGWGTIPKYSNVDWAAKGTRIGKSLRNVKKQIQESADPVRETHLFLLAKPEATLTKISKAKQAHKGTLEEETDYSQKDSRVFRRLGIDLLKVEDDGNAVVHIKPDAVEKLATTASALPESGGREQARWATISSFAMVPPNSRMDPGWLSSLRRGHLTDAVIEFQPVLMRSEIDLLIRTIAAALTRQLGETINVTGTDFSGRQWVRGKLGLDTLKKIAEQFFSVQSLHSPLVSIAAQASTKMKSSALTSPQSAMANIANLPSVGVVDTGIPSEHVALGPYQRGRYVDPNSSPTPAGSHGSFVASRVVFGDPDYSAGLPLQTPPGQCRYFDVNIAGIGPGIIDNKAIYPALRAVSATAPDVRVFNLSFDSNESWHSIEPVKKYEELTIVQDIDNFIFQNDIFCVIAAGNSPKGVIPSKPYPNHYDDPNWALGPLARSFNSVTCGSYVKHLAATGLVGQVGWPSPFCRTGPGLCSSRKPDFSANGGNSTPNYDFSVGLGVWGLSDAGFWEDRIGTSFAAPLLAREAAFCFQKLQQVCQEGARPFSITVKAFLALTAEQPVSAEAADSLIQRTLGRGTGNSMKLDKPDAHSAVMIWQGVIEGPDDLARVQIPIPLSWLSTAAEPFLRVVLSWDPPVNAAIPNVWATRQVSGQLRASIDGRALHSRTVGTASSYPLIERYYNLRRLPKGVTTKDDMWLFEISYKQAADYHPTIDFSPQQRVAFAAELIDRSPKPFSPQSAIQALPISQTMVRLSIPPVVVRTPIMLRTQL
jgi:hypothetical protein